jgi:16S rRNA (adenine1518-N6/adenine1519-N6)-dimethyltransferase
LAKKHLVVKVANLDPKKSLGQHWLTDVASLDSICQAAQLTPSDTVLEVGPGPGSLTKKLLPLTKQVVAVEFDTRLAAALAVNPAANLRVVHQDILDFDLSDLPAGYKVVANIPYYLTSALLRKLSESANPPSVIVLLVQKEVAQRVAAQPGQMSLLSVSVQLYYQAQLGMVVPAHLFTPPPKVDSQVLVLQRRQPALFADLNTKQFFMIVKAGYAARRKTLQNSLAGGLRLGKPQVLELLQAAGLEPTIRPQELSLDNWYQLYKAWRPLFPTPEK